jgi:orotidine-5'-phosphate decarboxylase
MVEHKIFCALDTPDLEEARKLGATLGPHVAGIKLGLEFFMAQGILGLKALLSLNVPIFLDLKFHDIPNTAAGAVREAAKLGVAYLTVHTSGGEAMLRAVMDSASQGAQSVNKPRPKVLGVTVLTSLNAAETKAIGLAEQPEKQVLRLAGLAATAGLDGVVASPLEAPLIKQAFGATLLVVTPGIRPLTAAMGDQQRTLTPRHALANGADYLVIGRPITQSPDPLQTLLSINQDIAAQ